MKLLVTLAFVLPISFKQALCYACMPVCQMVSTVVSRSSHSLGKTCSGLCSLSSFVSDSEGPWWRFPIYCRPLMIRSLYLIYTETILRPWSSLGDFSKVVVGKCWPRLLLNIRFLSFLVFCVDSVCFLWSEGLGAILLGNALYALGFAVLLVYPVCLWFSFRSTVMRLFLPLVPLLDVCVML
ncbi:hypothetical protein GQ457_08G004390 [Hibiscus cannabinus]